MKRIIITIILIATCCIGTQSWAQFKNPKNVWGLSVGGSHGSNATKDQWDMQYRGYFQHEVIPDRLLGQLGLGYTALVGSGTYSSYMGILDLRALYTPFSLPNLNPYIYGGAGVVKVLKNGSSFLPIVPLGAGIQTRIANGVIMDINTGYSIVFSDDLDGIVRSDNNLNSLTNGKHDGFYGVTLGVSFSLGSDDNEVTTQQQQLDAAEARRVRELAAAEAVRVKQQAQSEAVRVKQQADAKAAAKLAKEAADADARLLVAHTSRDTVIAFVKGKSIVLRGINFEFNKATLMKDSEVILFRAHRALMANPDIHIVITGHTDNIGNKESNQTLSLERAQTVRNWLVERGVTSSRLRTVGRGQNEPVATNETEDGRAQNRRMEFFVAQ
jgi:outer membrane protein OmpA-like peptidoglycan-associated protein